MLIIILTCSGYLYFIYGNFSLVELKSNPINRRAWKRWFLSGTVVEHDTFLDTRRKYPLRSNVLSLIVLSKKKKENVVWCSQIKQEL